MPTLQATQEKVTGDGGRDALETDTIHDLLRNYRRRWVIEEIATHIPEPVPKRDLTNAIAARELTENIYDDDPTEYMAKNRVSTALIQSHLPPLIEAKVILETNEGYVLGANAEPLLDHIRCERERAQKQKQKRNGDDSEDVDDEDDESGDSVTSALDRMRDRFKL